MNPISEGTASSQRILKDVAELKRLAGEATPGPWEMWTSCSWRRLVSKTGKPVCTPFVNRADKHPDMEISREDSAFIEAANPTVILELLAQRDELVEAASIGHADSPGMPCGDLLAAANVLRNHLYVELAERLEAKHAAESAAIERATP